MMIVDTFIALSLLSAAVSGAPAADTANPFHLQTPVCGPGNSNGNGVCVDFNSITSHPFEKWESNDTHYLYEQCYAACQTSTKCQTMLYYQIPSGLFSGAGWSCYLLSVPVTPYTIPCGNSKYGPGATPFAQNNSAIGQVFNPASQNTSALSNYFSKGCPALAPGFGGTVPSATGDQLLCSAYSTTQKSYADEISHSTGMDQSQCRDTCEKTPGCKSYWWEMYETPGHQPYGSPDETFGNTVNGNCMLYTQPVKQHGMFSESPSPIFDINCRPGNVTT